LVVFTQEVESDFPVSLRLTSILQPDEVCRVIWLGTVDRTFTASITSISPW
jgi:hypothetical protein